MRPKFGPRGIDTFFSQGDEGTYQQHSQGTMFHYGSESVWDTFQKRCPKYLDH